MAVTPTRLYDISRETLDAVVSIFAGAGIALPDRQYVHQGQIASDCVAAGTRVWTLRGALPIEDVREGDDVWVWRDGRMLLKPVLAHLDKGERPVVAIRTRHRTLRVTPEHKVLVARPHGPKPSYQGWFRSPRLTWGPEWVAAQDLSPGDFLVGMGTLPDVCTSKHLPDGTKLDAEIAWLIGAFVGDGHVSAQGIACCIFGSHCDRFVDIVSRRWGRECGHNDGAGAWVYAPELRELFIALGLHVKSPHRRIPDVIWGASLKVQEAFLEGYRDADGYLRREGFETFAATSRLLIEDVRALYMRVGHTVSNQNQQDRNGTITIKGKVIKNALPLHGFSAYPRPFKDWRVLRERARAVYGNDFRPDRVVSVTEAGVSRVYDLTVEDDHNFLADGLVVHNCEQVVVTLLRVFTGSPGAEEATAEQCGGKRTGEFEVRIERCVPVPDDDGNPPSAAALDASALQLNTDMWVLVTGLILAYHARPREWLNDCQLVAIGNATAIGPTGAFGGVALTLEILTNG